MNNGNNNAICADQLPIYTGQTKTFVCKQPIKGRYVNIHLPGYHRTLTLCEVEVIAKGTKSLLNLLFHCLEFLEIQILGLIFLFMQIL